MIRLGLRAALVLALTAALGALPAHAQGAATPEWLSCPASIGGDGPPPRDQDPTRIREVAPSAGANTSAELHAHARLASVAYALYAAYADAEDPRTAFAQPGMRLTSLIWGDPGRDTERPGPLPRRDGRTLYGFVADEVATGRRYIVFRGTQEPAEWARNAQALQRPYPSTIRRRLARTNVHAGFLAIFESLRLDEQTTPFAEALPGLVAERDTVFVGHSLGSALATLAGVDASRRAPASAARLRVVTLASPRVGDAGFAAFARAVGRIDRVCNMPDVVTMVPPSGPRTEYVHVGHPFVVSSFDWAALNNNLRAGDQVLCWHGDQAYAYMLLPSAGPPPAQCRAP